MCYVQKYVHFCIFIMFKSLPGLDLRRFVYPHTFSTNGNPIRHIDPPDASGGYYGFCEGTPPPPQCVDDFSLPLCSQKY